MAVAPASAWIREWNAIIRTVIFPDETLKKLMLLPEDTKLVKFLDKYFIRVGYTDQLLTNEDVRIVYGNVYSGNAYNPMTMKQEMSFDIYVKNEHAHDVGDDRLMLRGELIQERLNQLLKGRVVARDYNKDNKPFDTAYKFYCIGMGNLGSPTPGYNAFNITFTYIRTV